MAMEWACKLIDRLVAGVRADGGWAYRTETRSSAEPTAMAVLALAAHDVRPDLRSGGVSWLGARQRADGSVGVLQDVGSPGWPTAPAILAWIRAEGNGACAPQVDRALAWLLHRSGVRLRPDPRVFGHDTTLTGWPWVRDTHSWVEPTSHALLALRAAGLADHERVREGTRLLVDRTLREGGWNYGNTRVLEHTLQPFPATTGVALAALSSLVGSDRVDASIDYLTGALARVRSPYSLGWGLIGLAAWGALPAASEAWFAESAARALGRRPNFLDDAVLLLGAADRRILTEQDIGGNHASRRTR